MIIANKYLIQFFINDLLFIFHVSLENSLHRRLFIPPKFLAFSVTVPGEILSAVLERAAAGSVFESPGERTEGRVADHLTDEFHRLRAV